MQTVRSLLLKSVEMILVPRIAAESGRTEELLQLRGPVLAEIRTEIVAVMPEEGPFEIVVEVGLAGSNGMVTVERWSYVYVPTFRTDIMDETGFYKAAALTLRAIVACAVLLPAVIVFPNRLQYRISLCSGDMQAWPVSVPVKTIRPIPSVTSCFGDFRLSVSYRDPLPPPPELFPVSSTLLSGSDSPKTRSRLPSSGNIVAIAAKCASDSDTGYIPLCTSFTDDQDMYMSGSESDGEMQLVMEVEGEGNSAVFRRACKEAQDLRLFSGRELPALRVYLEDVKRIFESVRKSKEELQRTIIDPKVV